MSILERKSVPSLLLGAALLLAGCRERDAPPQYSIVARMVPLSVDAAAISAPPTPGAPRYEVATLGGEGFRVATVAASTGTLSWPVEVPRSARLRFGYSASQPFVAGELRDERAGRQRGVRSRGGTVSIAVDFRHPDGRTTRLFRTMDTLDNLRLAAREVELGLENLKGDGELVFSASAPEAPADASIRWINPRLLAPVSDTRRNLIVICVDTLRADRLTDLGDRTSPMPATTKRLADAAVFTHAYANASWSLPSMASILTGLLPGEHLAGRRTTLGDAAVETDFHAGTSTGGIELVLGGKRQLFQMLHPSVTTLPERLGEAGWETAAIHNNGYIDYATRVLQGTDYFDHYSKLDATVGTDRAIDWLRQRDDSNFFLFLHYIDPHQWPGQLPKGTADKPPEALSDEERAQVLAAYDALCRHADGQLERLFLALKDIGLDENTYVVLLADHGERFFDPAPGAADARFHGHGDSFHETVMRVPLVLWGPGVVPRRIDTRVNLVDVAPTALELLGVGGAAELSGKSLLPLLDGKTEPDRDVLSEYVLDATDQLALLQGKWKYFAFDDATHDLLFDLEGPQPHERTSLVAEQPDIAQAMRRVLLRHRNESDRRFAGLTYGATQIDPETYESLKALGYVGN